MKVPYTIYIDDECLDHKMRVQDPPNWCRYRLSFAKEKHLFKTPELELFSQQLNLRPFFIDLVEIDVKKPTSISFVIHDRQLFMYFMLKGCLLYTTREEKPIVKTPANTLMMSYYDNGIYSAYAEKGRHIALVICIHPEWIKSITQDYQNILYILQKFDDSNLLFEIMHQRRMDRKIQRWLYRIYSYSCDNRGALDGNLRKYISLLLEYYNDLLGDLDIAFEIKTFLEANYCKQSLNIKFIADHFNMTERTLSNVFKRRYHLTIQRYFTDLRIEMAIILMNQKHVGIKDVYMQVGYADERTFRYALESYQKRNK